MSRPPTGNGGSRPPTSRFQEGSMNDRVSAAPPPQFLGPEQIREYEKQFYMSPVVKATTTTTHRDSRKKHRERPLSESQSLKSQSPKSPLSNVSTRDQDQRFITHKKSNGFFSRIRDALFNKASGVQAQAQAQPPPHKQQEAIRKHTSLQEPLLAQRTGQLHPLVQHYTDMQGPQPPAGDNITSRGGTSFDRPTREEVMQSYNQLMASGFFKAHAIQSTRHARPPTVQVHPPMPSIASAPGSPDPPPRISSINAVTMKPKSPPPSSPNSVRSRYSLHISPQLANANMPSRLTPDAKADLRRSSGYGPPAKEPRYALRGRKRNRTDVDEASQASSTGTSSGMPLSPTLAAATLAQPFKRVAKKLRKMPSSPASSDSKLNAATPPRPATSAAAVSNMQTADGVVRLVASVSTGGTLYHDERALRLRSPSPAPAKPINNADAKANGNVKNARVTRSMAAPQRNASGANKLRKRAKSPALRPRSSGAPYIDQVNQFEIREVTERRPLTASNQARDSFHNKQADGDNEAPSSPMPLSVIPDVNRGIPSVPRIPDQYSRVPNKLSKAGRGRNSWLKAKQSTDENCNDFDTHRMDIDVEGAAKWQVGEAL
ncbi:hypothetical protein F4810DRAFT_169343 [Camillea tinctor]|nr:hypothetical protein F4810DRAFT_169343 [Camillea tinctor]